MDDFYRYYAPDFNFLYPKSVFAYSEADDETNSYYLSSADGSMTLEFYEEDTGYYHQVIDIAWYENLYGR